MVNRTLCIPTLQREQNQTYKNEERGKEYELFVDHCYYGMVCVREVGDKDFHSEGSYHFNTMKDAQVFLELLLKAS